jgi:alpha-glucosidase
MITRRGPRPGREQTVSETTSSDWWRGCVIYQVYPRSYQDTSGDGIGDIRGIIERLDHIASLGVDAIWLSPFFKSPMADFGYDVSDYCDVDPMFGTLSDFDELVELAHARKGSRSSSTR